MPDANAFLDFRMRANHARRRAQLVRQGPLFDVLGRVHDQEASRFEAMATEEMAAMAKAAEVAGRPTSFPLARGWAIEVKP